MRRVWGTVLALAVLALAVVFPALVWDIDFTGADPEPEPTSISDYRARFVVSDAGQMQATEEVTVSFPSWPGRHGIFRFFDRADPNAPRLRREPQDIAVHLDGGPVDVVEGDESRGRYRVARIGSEHAMVPPGEHTYRIAYSVDDVLLPGDDGGSRFYWNLVPGGWAQDIARSRLVVDLPGTARDVSCAVGAGEPDGCTARGEGTSRLVVTTGPLASRTPVTVSADLDLEVAEPTADRWWGPRWDAVLGTSLPLLVLVLVLAAAAGWGGFVVVRRTIEREPGFPLAYAPPAGIGPAQGQFILEERVSRTAFVATVMQLAERGTVDLDRSARTWTVSPAEGADWASLDVVSEQTARALGLREGMAFAASPDSVADGQMLKQVMETHEQSTRAWASGQGLVAAAGLGAGGGLLIVMAGLLAGVLAIWNPGDMSATALVPGAFAATGFGLLLPGAGTRRTKTGRRMWAELGGFRRVLSTPSSQQRFEFSGRHELYTTYLPWAVAFGVADDWAAKYRTETGAEPPVPVYFAGGYSGVHTGNHVDQMINDLDHTVSSAISSYQASQRSSSGGGGGGGGGFSGGGGGGGGGGGSW